MRTRLLTALIGMPLLLVALFYGGLWWSLFIGFVVALGLSEWYTLVRRYTGTSLPPDALFGGGLLFVYAAYIAAEQGVSAPGFGPGAVLFFVAVYTLLRATFRPSPQPIVVAGGVLLGVVYVAGLFSHLILLRGLQPDGLIMTTLAIFGTWVTDTAAFFVGRSLGGRRLIPALSPGKTVAGAVGGWVSGFVVLAVAGVFWAMLPLSRALALAAIVPVVAQLGDLVESAIKREAQIKDTGDLLPGHGGILDRFDSLMLVGTTVYYITVWL